MEPIAFINLPRRGSTKERWVSVSRIISIEPANFLPSVRDIVDGVDKSSTGTIISVAYPQADNLLETDLPISEVLGLLRAVIGGEPDADAEAGE